ncbi:hypothetical protein [Streptomyces nigrescens]|uniref:hypothetical protein n=1 Tax=Streptomyces nigrescens TaxID=1920 RepID=UPI0037004D81
MTHPPDDNARQEGADRGVRRTASTITDLELDALYAQRDLLLFLLLALSTGARP